MTIGPGTGRIDDGTRCTIADGNRLESRGSEQLSWRFDELYEIGVLDILSYFRRRQAPARRKPVADDEAIDLATIGGAISTAPISTSPACAACAPRSAQQAAGRRSAAGSAKPTVAAERHRRAPPDRAADRRRLIADAQPQRPVARRPVDARRSRGQRRSAGRAQGRALASTASKKASSAARWSRASASTCATAKRSACSARTAPARPPCST